MPFPSGKEIKHIIFDLDGTLLNQEMEITAFSYDGLSKIIQTGISISIITSRPVFNVISLLKGINIHYIAGCNGALIFNNQKTIFESKQYINKDIALELFDFTQKDNLILNVYKDETVFTNKIADSFYNKKYQRSINVKKLKNFNFDNILMFEIIDEDNKFVKKLKTYFLKKYNKKINIIDSGYGYYQITDIKVSKKDALFFIAEKESIALENFSCFGDSKADIDMLKAVGVPVLMSNSKYKLKEKFLLTEFDNSKDGAIRFALNMLK